MRSSPLKIFALGLVLVLCASGAEQAGARSRKHRLDPPSVPSIMVDETGTPVIMQGLKRPKRAAQDRHHANKEAERRVNIPRGSAALVPSGSLAGVLPRTPLMGPPLAVAPYNPPSINSPSDRIMQYNQSFQLNRGLGNNPTNRDAYIRYHLNN